MSLARFASLPRRSHSVLSRLVTQHRATTQAPLGAAWRHAIVSVWSERFDIKRFLLYGDEGLAHDLRVRFGLGADLGRAHKMPHDLFFTGSVAVSDAPSSIIIPVFDGAEFVEPLLTNLPQTLSNNQHVILVNDGSDDPTIAALIDEFATHWPNTTVVHHDENLGFAAAVNAAFQQMPADFHAVLLNTDTIPPDGWVQRLLAPLDADPGIATVTPLSNNAEILSVPRAGIEEAPDMALIEQLDTVAQNLRPNWSNVPTGVGFCMALNRTYLDKLGGFDLDYGRGYGEEVDWCCAAAALGGRHVVATNLVVGHVGHASFGATERKARIAKASRRIAERYPRYPEAALDWESSDPIGPERLALALAWVAQRSDQPVPIFVAHSLGGGAETAMRREIAACLSSGLLGVTILRVGGPAPWRLELEGERYGLAGDIEDEELLHKLLAPISERRVVYSCGVFAADPSSVPRMLCRLAEGQRLEIRMHDFFPISPSWNLLDGEGRFSGVPALDTKDAIHSVAATGGRIGVSHRMWRRAWGRAMRETDEITVFSTSSAEIVADAYPDSSEKIVLRPHRNSDRPSRVPPGGQTIGVLGAINLAKGGRVLVQLAEHTRRRIAVIGEMDGQFRLPKPNIVHGTYARTEIASLAKRYDIGAWLMPSICPETFSFATHEVLATGLPVACFNLGAQAEAVSDAENGCVVTSDPDDTASLAKTMEALFGR